MFEVLILFAAIQVISGYPSENVSGKISHTSDCSIAEILR